MPPAQALVKAWVADPNVDVLSPQLYSSGSEVPVHSLAQKKSPRGFEYPGFLRVPSLIQTGPDSSTSKPLRWSIFFETEVIICSTATVVQFACPI